MAQAQGLYTHDKDATGLTRRQREVLAAINDENLSQLDAAEKLGISRQRVRQIVEDLIRKGIDVKGARAPSVTTD